MEEQKLLKKKQKAKANNAGLVSACTDLAAYYISVEKYSKAIKEYEALCDIYREENKLIQYAQANRGIGEAYMGLHEHEKALKYLKIYLNVSIQEKHILEQQRALAQLGHMYLTWFLETLGENNKELLNKAYGYFMKSLQKCDSLPDNVEKQDMLARLFSNLGLVKESLGDYETSLSLYEKSIKICLNHDLYEQLYRGYLSLASLFEKQQMYQETIKHYNLAIEIAKKLSSNKVELLCAALLAKSETLIKIADFIGAKQVLRKAYKFKTRNHHEKEIIERNLRVVAGMCQVEDEIITCNDQKLLKNLYEKMGDGACDLKNFPKALEYYSKMLETAEKNGASDKELGECYYSLGETYKDNGQFKEAELYFEKEYNLCKNSLKDSLNTLCKIADIKEMADENIEEIKKIYERGLDNCRKKRNLMEEKRIVIRYLAFLKRSSQLSGACKLEKYLIELNERIEDDGTSSSSDYESEDPAKVHIGDNIVLSDITDVSEESDNEVPEASSVPSSKRRKQSTVKFKKNLNGEWPLHVACIRGNLKMVQYWLGVDHPVNVRDNAGWLPLHEAAVHGHLEIVKLLLDHKATINDRGGSECNGITPLHDAASNGHLEVVELLLDRGASAVAKTDDGNTPLFELKRWYESICSSLNEERQRLYDQLIRRLEEALERAGQKDVDKNTHSLYDSESPMKENRFPDRPVVGRLRRNALLEEDTPSFDEDSSESFENTSQSSRHSEQSASNEYQMVMQTLRHKNYASQKQSSSPVKSNIKRSALIDADEFVDDDTWLEEDIRPTKSKKRRTGDAETLWGGSRSFGGSCSSNRSPRTSGSNVRIEDVPLQNDNSGVPEHVLVDDADEDFYETTPNQRRISNESNGSGSSALSKRRTQVTLLDSGFSRRRNSNSPRISLSLKRHGSFENQTSTTQSKITTFGTSTRTVVEADSTTLPQAQNISQMELSQAVVDPTLFVDVEIEGRLFRVPVLLSQIQNRTIKWLAEEAAHRYASKEYIKPALELETVSGAILADEDLLSLLFPMGSTQAEKVIGKVTEWSLPPLIERYRDTCAHMNVDVNTELCQLIETLSVNLDLSNRGALSEELCPLIKAINHQKTLTEIKLSGNFINKACMTMLCSSLGTLPNLQALNLSCTCLKTAHLSLLANTFSSDNKLSKLTHLDVSDNISLTRECLQPLSVITKALNLISLNLSNISLSNVATFQDMLFLKTVQTLDVSNNALNDSDIRKITLWTDGNVLKELNVSNNKGSEILKQIVEAFGNESVLVLEKIDLQRCGVKDSDLFELLSNFFLNFQVWDAWSNTNNSLARRSAETLETKSKLQNHFHKVQQEIFDLEKNIELLKKSIIDKSAPMKVAHTRLEARTHRKDIELCRDTAQDRLVNEVRDLQDSIEYLHKKLQEAEAEAQHQQLLKTRANLEEDLHAKCNSLFIDREKCMGMRRSFPITSTIKY